MNYENTYPEECNPVKEKIHWKYYLELWNKYIRKCQLASCWLLKLKTTAVLSNTAGGYWWDGSPGRYGVLVTKADPWTGSQCVADFHCHSDQLCDTITHHCRLLGKHRPNCVSSNYYNNCPAECTRDQHCQNVTINENTENMYCHTAYQQCVDEPA